MESLQSGCTNPTRLRFHFQLRQDRATANYVFAAGRHAEDYREFKAYITSTTTHPDGKVPRVRGMFGNNGSARIADIKDGTSNVVAVGESVRRKSDSAYNPVWGQTTHTGIYGRVITQSDPNHVDNCRYRINSRRIDCAAFGDTSTSDRPLHWVFSSEHSGGAHFLMGDGSVKFFSQNMDYFQFALMNYIAGGFPVDVPN